MPQPQPRTGLSFGASDMSLEDGSLPIDSETITILDNDGFKTPSEPASASQRREMSKLRSQLDKVLQQLQEKEEKMERQRKEDKEQLEQQKKESKEQLEQQRKESKEQLDRLMQVLSMLRNSKGAS